MSKAQKRMTKRERKAEKSPMARYITIPKKVKLPSVINRQTNKPVEYGLLELLGEYCWPNEAWRSSPVAIDVFCRVQPLFDDVDEGDIVELEAADYEVFVPIATLRGEKIRQDLIVPFMRLIQSITSAPTVRPESEEDEDEEKVEESSDEATDTELAAVAAAS